MRFHAAGVGIFLWHAHEADASCATADVTLSHHLTSCFSSDSSLQVIQVISFLCPVNVCVCVCAAVLSCENNDTKLNRRGNLSQLSANIICYCMHDAAVRKQIMQRCSDTIARIVGIK